MELSGTWRAAPGDDQLRRDFVDPGFADAGWADVPVPGHWRSTPALADADGPVLYRRRFDAPRLGAGRRSFLVLEGCFYLGDVWLDGAYLGNTEGYFQPHAFEITTQRRDRTEHVLAVELSCTRPLDLSAKRDLTGAFQHSDSLDPGWNPGGIWRPVGLVETGRVRIASLRARCPEATAERAHLLVTARLDATEGGEVELRSTVEPGGVEHVHTAELAAGGNEVSWRVDVPDPPLWWPRAFDPTGSPPALVDLVVEARISRGDGDDGRPSDVTRRRTGLRQVRMHDLVLEVNGERLFLKGASLDPCPLALGETPAAGLVGDVALAQDAGLDLLRVHAHISRPELYEAADRAGLLLWQDLPLRGGYTRTVRAEAVRQARAAVDLLAHHPSVALWCAHAEPVALDSGLPPAQMLRRFVRHQLLPSWATTVLDPTLAEALDRADGSRPVLPHSGVLPHPAGGTDTPAWFGWHHGAEDDLPRWLRRLPVLARFVGAFGAQAVPETADWMQPERWPDLDWDELARTTGLQKAVFDRRVPPAAFATFAAWRTASQVHQASTIRHHVESVRRLKYRPSGGFCLWSLADAQPAISWSVLDHDRVPKLGYAALAAACAPVIVTADRPAASYRPGAAVALDVHVVSDLRHPLEGCSLAARLAWPGDSHEWAFGGDVPADAVARVGTLSFLVPDAPGPLVLDLHLTGPATASASYASVILPAS